MKDKFIELEKTLDKKVSELEIWKMPFQSILSALLITIESIDNKGDTQRAMDYCSRLSYLYDIVKKHGANAAITTTNNALVNSGVCSYVDDIKFLNGYAHFSMLMPQVHRGTLIVTKVEGNKYKLDYANKETQQAELIDMLYCYVSLQAWMSFKGEKEFEEYLDAKVKRKETKFTDMDFEWVKSMHHQFEKLHILIQPLPPAIFEKATSVTYEEYHSFTACVRAYAEYYMKLGRAYLKTVNKANPTEEDEQRMAEYYELTVCCMKTEVLERFNTFPGLSDEKLKSIFSFYLLIYSDTSGKNFASNAFCGDGYFPPFVLAEQYFVFSPHALRCMLNVNNILYSINKLQKGKFDNEISEHLEPTLLNQLEYVFGSLNGVKLRKNINYPKSEVDMFVLSEEEKVCLNVQVKTTLGPDSSRTVKRVQDRALEGIHQLKLFSELPANEQLALINKEFGTELKEIKGINLLVVKSGAGTEEIWKYNDEYRIVNYPLLTWILSNKIAANNHKIRDIENEIRDAQEQLIARSEWEEKTQVLQIGDVEIEFPNLDFNGSKVQSIPLQCYKSLADFEKAIFN